MMASRGKKGQPLQTRTFETGVQAEQWARAIEVEMDKGVFVSPAEAESTTLKEVLERYLAEITPLKKGAVPETNRLRALMRLPGGAQSASAAHRATGAGNRHAPE